MLAELARGEQQLASEVQRQPQTPIFQVEVQLGRMALLHPILAPAPDLGGQCACDVLGQAQHLTDVAHCALGPKAHHRGADRRPVPPVGVVDPLDHLLAAAGLEVDVDVGRLAPLHADEALEQQLVSLRVDAGDAEHEADRGVGGRSPALAEDPLPPGKLDDGVHGQEVGRVRHGPDQLQLMTELAGHLFRHALGVDSLGRLPGELL